MSDEPTHNVRESADKIRVETKVKRGTETRDQDEIKVKVRGDDPDTVVERLNDVVSNLQATADEVRSLQPAEADDEWARPADEYRDARRKHERLAQARAVAGPEPTTVYRVTDDRGGSEEVRKTERAERLSRAGYRVTAVSHTEGQR